MSKQNQSVLTLAFIDREPRSAARVLETIDADDAAAFIDSMPARVVASSVSHMIPWSAARCLEKVNLEHASGLLRAMDYSDAVSILRLMDDAQREELLELSTRQFSRNFRKSVVYPKDTVGAWMDVGVPSFEDTMLVKDAVRTVRRMATNTSHIFLTDTNKHYAGTVPVADLFRRDENAALAELADHSLKPLSNRDSIQGCQGNAGWDRLTLLPVIGRKRNFLGALSRSGLRKALTSQDAAFRIATPGSVLMQLLDAFVTVGTEFANLTLLQNHEMQPTREKENSRARKRKNRKH